jgi:hypothetical protein
VWKNNIHDRAADYIAERGLPKQKVFHARPFNFKGTFEKEYPVKGICTFKDNTRYVVWSC